MDRDELSRREKLLWGMASVTLVILLYCALSWWQHSINPKDTSIPNLQQFMDGIKKFTQPDRHGERWIIMDAAASGIRLFLGLITGIFFSVILGILMGRFNRIEAFFRPVVSISSKFPPTAALAVFFAMVGLDLEMYVTMIAFGIIPSMAESIKLRVKSIPRQYLDEASTMGASKTELIFNVIFPYILPDFLDLVRQQIGPAMVYLIAAEMVVGDVGFGYRIRIASKQVEMNITYPYIIMLAGFGYCMDYLFTWIKYRFFSWGRGYTKDTFKPVVSKSTVAGL